MKKLKAALSLLLTAGMVTLFIAGCSQSTTTTPSPTSSGSGTPSASPSQSPEKKQIITANITTEPAQLNSVLAIDVPSMNILLSVQEGLVRLDQNNQPVGGLAESWDVTEDKLTYTFHLRDALWSDGTAVTANDFAYAWLSALDKDSGASNVSYFFTIKGGAEYNAGTGKTEDVGIKVINDKTLEVTLVRPTPYFLTLCAKSNFLPVKQSYYEAQTSSGGNTYGTDVDKLLYCGPWTMTEWVHNNKIVLTKNENYYNKDEIKLDTINLVMVNDSGTAYNMFTAGQLDTTDLNTADDMELASQSGYNVVSYASGGTTYMAFNVADPVMQNANIRKAFSYAVDRESFVKNVLKNGTVAAYSLTNPVVQGKTGSFQEELAQSLTKVDMSEAKAYLDKGLAELGLNQAPQFTFLIDDRESIKLQAAVYQEYWKKNLGVDVAVESMPYKAKLEKQYAKDFMITISGWATTYNDPMAFLELFGTGDPNNSSYYTNTAYDDLLLKARDEKDASLHYDYLKQAELILMDDAPLAPLYYAYKSYAVSERLQGFIRNSFSDMNFYYAYIEE